MTNADPNRPVRVTGAGSAPLIAAPTIPPRAGLAGLMAWLRRVRFRQILSVPFWMLAIAMLTASDLLAMFVTNFNEARAASRGGNLMDVIGVFSMVIAARLGASTAAQLRSLHPDRAPVLYLRSFGSDKTYYTQPTDEEILSRIFRTIGPFVAIGRPGQAMPDVGSAKLFVGDHEWQETVDDHLEQAQVVVLKMGVTPGFKWEIQRVFERMQPEQILLYMSIYENGEERARTYETLVEIIQPLIPHALPTYQELENTRIIAFDSEWRPMLLAKVPPPDGCWRKGFGCMSLGLALPVMRPILTATRSRNIATGLRPIRKRYVGPGEEKRVFGRVAVTICAYLGGWLALTSALAVNQLRAGTRRTGWLLGAAALLLFVLPGLSEITATFGMVFALAVYHAWPAIAPIRARRQLAFGGDAFAWPVTLLLVLAGMGASIFAPLGIPARVLDEDRAAVFTVEDIDGLEQLGIEVDPTRGRITKRVMLNGQYLLRYEYDEPELFVYTEVTGGLLDLGTALMGDLMRLELDAPLTAVNRVGSWQVRTYEQVTEGGEVAGNVIVAELGSTFRSREVGQYYVTISGVVFGLDDLSPLIAEKLFALENVRGLVPY